jgi:hypothetical protein
MNERIIIRLTEDGKHLPINSLTSEGFMLRNETDATPRGFAFEFDGDNAIMKSRMARIRELHGWHPHIFKLELQVFEGNLVATGVNTRSLPAGRYWFRLRISDLNLPTDKITVDVPEDGDGRAEVKVKKDKRDVRLTAAVTAFDGDIRRVVEVAASRLDGAAASEWLTSRSPRPGRKACLLNLLAKLRATPTASDHLIRHVQHVFFADVDRVYARVDRELHPRLLALSEQSPKSFVKEGSPKSAGHRRLLDRVALVEGGGVEYDLHSFRQASTKNSVQAVVAVPKDPTRNHYADFDIDLGNPLQDLVGFVIHMGELINPGKTDHMALRENLGKNKTIAPFLFYDVVKNS